eukprot:TRINITY_DN7278_c0_g1_i1.p1 TRINITY_DN7278_c0_g1~~TRINITY_DN7278_c0_g1_i1.p1  ORF type:complete len:599 (+),score=126.39 TRINITY_DN7278_c0_g1_i1:88-1884(+)
MDITSSLTQEIVSQCQKKGFVVPPQLAAFFVKTLVMQESREERRAVELSSKRIEQLVEQAVQHLTQSDSPALETFKMQAAILTQQQDSLNASRTETVHHRAKAQQLLQEVCAKTDHNKVFGDIVLYILHETGLFNSTNELVQKETMTALESVISRSSIESFVSQTDADKMKQMDELWKIVWGIRLFNRETRKGGSGIQDVPGELASMIQQAQSTLTQQTQTTAKLAEHYLSVLSSPATSSGLDVAQRQRLNDEYVNRKQFLQFAERVSAAVDAIAGSAALLRPQYDALIVEVRQMVTASSSVPRSQIYPKFIEISEKWDGFKQLHANVKEQKKLLDLLLAYQHSYTQTLRPGQVEAALKAEEGQEKLKANLSLLEQEINTSTRSNGCFFVPSLPPLSKPRLNGFCATTLVDQGLLRQGDPTVGFLKFKDSVYSFADEQSLKSFVSNPNHYVEVATVQKPLQNSALVHLLDLERKLPQELYLEGTRQRVQTVQVQKCDADTQTGQIDPYKDYKYEWNEWELRRLALKLADLRKKKTTSGQTHLSHFKRDNDTQTYPKKETLVQTMVDQSTQPTRTVRYIAGLRGDPESRIRIAQMTFDE